MPVTSRRPGLLECQCIGRPSSAGDGLDIESQTRNFLIVAMALTITEKAANELKRMLHGTQPTRVDHCAVSASQGAGAVALSITWTSPTPPTSRSTFLPKHPRRTVAVDRKSMRFLDGTQVDYHDDLIKRGFVFNNPLAVKTCGCGSSFQV